MTKVTIDSTYNGPPHSGNGGWTAGMFAAASSATSQALQVKLLQPPPLNTEMNVETSGQGWELTTQGTPIATLQEVTEPLPQPPAAVPPDVARTSQEAFLRDGSHPFPTCYVCGPDHVAGMGLFTGPTGGPDNQVACLWQTAADVPLPALWAALDCPSGWAAGLNERPMVLGTITAQITSERVPAGQVVIVAQRLRATNRTATAASALWLGGNLIGQAVATWVEVDPEVFVRLRR